jgi:fibronectin type 3 domain-containing protein
VSDLDGDGDLDLAVANYYGDTVSVLRGNGHGSFGSGVEYNVGDAPYDVAVGDFNGDGDADLAVADRGSNSVSVLLGTGGGSFGSAVSYGAGGSPSSLGVGDLDGDGALDLVVANTSTDDVSVLFGNGNGTFGSAEHYIEGGAPTSVALGDLDDDGALDIVTANSQSDNVSVLLGEGGGGFRTAEYYAVGGGPISVVAGYFDGDTAVDVAVANAYTDNVSVLLGNGDGTLGGASHYGVGDVPYAVASGDLNGDGDLDLAVANAYTDNISVLLGNGNGTFGSASHYGAGDFPQSVAVGDLNGDGDLDLAVANSSSDNISVLLGNGNGTFGSASHYGAGDSPYSVAVGDFDGDGDLDLASANRNSDNVSVLLGNGNGTFGSASHYGVGDTPYSVAAGDLNGDGDLDLAVTNRTSGTVSVLLGNGNGTFGSDVEYATCGGPSSVAVGDVTGDGHLDLAVANNATDNLTVLPGGGDGTFGRGMHFGAGNAPISVAIVDIDGDWHLDVLSADYLSDDVSVLVNTSTGAGQDPPPAVPTGLAATSGPGEGEIAVSWNANSEPDFDHYYLERSTTAGFVPGTVVALNTTSTSFQDWGLVPGAVYYYRVSAVDDGQNQSAPSAVASAAAGTGEDLPPAAPTGLTANPGPGEGEITVSWNANSEPDLDHYHVERSSSPVFGGGTVSFDTSATSYEDGGLTPGETYYYRVSAVDAGSNVSDPSGTVSQSALDLAPAVPTGLTATSGPGEGEIAVSWNANSEPDLDHYHLERSSSPVFGGGAVSFDTSATSYQDAGLTPGETYYYRVSAVDAGSNESDPSAVASAPSGMGEDPPPAAPAGLAAVSGPGEGEVTVSWNASGEPDFDHYRLERDTTQVFGAGTVSFDTSTTSYQDAGLIPGGTYYYRVIAVDTGSNESDPSTPVSADALDLAPAAPTGLVATPGPGDGEVLVSWDANGEPDLDHYRLQRATSPAFGAGTLTFHTPANSRQDSGLTPGETYYYRVMAEDAGANVSEPSTVVSAVAPGADPAPATPTGLDACGGACDGEILVSWDPNGEPDLDHYRLERDTTPTFGAGTVQADTPDTSYHDSGLTPGETYYYRVVAVDTASNESDPSAAASAEAPDFAPAAPTGVAAESGVGEGEILVGWDANSEPDLDHYRLERSSTPVFGPDRIPIETPETSHQDSGLTPGETYYYRVIAVDAGVNESDPSSVASATAADFAPAAPSDLAAAAGPGQGEVTLTWSANTEPDLDRYRVERDTVELFGPSAVIFWATDATYLDSGLEVGVSYYYRVFAVDVGGNESAPSPTVEIVLIGTGLPESSVASLSVAGPNPSRSEETAFAYSVPRGGAPVSIAIYDVAGRTVRTVVDRFQDGGAYEIVWDGRDRNGRRVGSGVYFCRAAIGDWTDKRKLVIVR